MKPSLGKGMGRDGWLDVVEALVHRRESACQIGGACTSAWRLSSVVTCRPTTTPSRLSNQQTLDFSDLVVERVESSRAQAEARGVGLVLEAVDPVRISGDGLLLRLAVDNLLDNAIKYTQPGGWVRVALLRRGRAAVLTVADNGVGISEEALPQIFSRFYREDSSRTRKNGRVGPRTGHRRGSRGGAPRPGSRQERAAAWRDVRNRALADALAQRPAPHDLDGDEGLIADGPRCRNREDGNCIARRYNHRAHATARGHPPRSVRDHRFAWIQGPGRGLSRERLETGSHGSDQGAAPSLAADPTFRERFTTSAGTTGSTAW